MASSRNPKFFIRSVCRHHPKWEPYALIGAHTDLRRGRRVTCAWSDFSLIFIISFLSDYVP
jgi:hypothetical protein